VATVLTGGNAMKKPKPRLPEPANPEPTIEEIRNVIPQRAYELFEQRGKEGRDFDDWIKSESEVVKKSTKQC
jgi:hypothetical protein